MKKVVIVISMWMWAFVGLLAATLLFLYPLDTFSIFFGVVYIVALFWMIYDFGFYRLVLIGKEAYKIDD